MSRVSKGVMELPEDLNNDRGVLVFRISCDCGNKDCDLTMSFWIWEEKQNSDRDFPPLPPSIDLYFDSKCQYRQKDYVFTSSDINNKFFRVIHNWLLDRQDSFRDLMYRVKAALKLLFEGSLLSEDLLLIRNPEHLDNIILSLLKCRRRYREFMAKHANVVKEWEEKNKNKL